MYDDHLNDDHLNDELDTLFAAARQPTAADLGAADHFLATRPATGQTGQQQSGRGGQRHALRLWAGTALGLAAALGGLTLLRPATPELPASAAYSVYQSALGEGW